MFEVNCVFLKFSQYVDFFYNSEVHAVYNPLPGSWFAVAYLENYEEPHGLSRKCR